MPTPTFDNRNENRINIKTDSTVKLIQELSKLGVFKSKKRPKKKRDNTGMDGIKQDSDMVGYAKSIGGPQMRNLPPIQQIQQGMSQSQIEDIQRRNDAVVAALRGEVQQQRLEDIEAQQGQRFADITKLGGIMNPLLERFRGSTFPAQAMGDEPIDPFSSRRGGAILLGNAPDIQEERFTQTLNEGGPPATEKVQTTSFVGEEEEELPGIPSEKMPVEKTGGGSAVVRTAQDAANELGLGKIPNMKNSLSAIEDYYIALTDIIGDRDPSSDSKSKMLRDIDRILKSYNE